MKRLNDASYCESLKNRICQLESTDFWRHTISYYIYAILSIEESRSLLASHSLTIRSKLLVENLKTILVKQAPVLGYNIPIVYDNHEKIIAMALVDILSALIDEQFQQEQNSSEQEAYEINCPFCGTECIWEGSVMRPCEWYDIDCDNCEKEFEVQLDVVELFTTRKKNKIT